MTADNNSKPSNQNAISHGLLSKEVLLPGEDGTLLNALRKRLMIDFQPQGEMETILVERIVSSTWRLKRMFRIERHSAVTTPLELAADDSVIIGGDYRYFSWQNYIRYETAIERQIYRAMHELERLQRSRLGHTAQLPWAKDLDISDPPSPGP
jgi:hypothetical protein